MRSKFDFDWRFAQQEISGAETSGFDDSAWMAVDLPHDFSISGPIAESNPGGRSMGFYPAGIGWYRKTFAVPSQDWGKRVFIDFDGAYWQTDVWINGHHLGSRPNGCIGFRFELTPHLHRDQGNVIAVRVNNSEQPNARWYTGSGIYRHCWLVVADPLHIAHWGTYVTTPEITTSRARVHVELALENQDASAHKAKAGVRIRDAEGHVVAETERDGQFAAGSDSSLSFDLEVNAPHLWSPEGPYLYSVESIVHEDGYILDQHVDPLGIRSFTFDLEKGFILNGQRVLLKGVNNHQNMGGVGAAVPDRMIERNLEILKSMGCNAIRTSHYAHSPVFLDLCDRMGFLVMDEMFDEWFMPKRDFSYARHFHEWWERDLVSQIRRDRNHPCVILWSIGNENKERATAEGVEMAKKMVARIHELDPTRPVTAGINMMQQAVESGFNRVFDIVGYNDGGGSCFHVAEHKALYPEMKALGSETPHTFATRGVYRTRTRHRSESGDFQPWEKDHLDVPHLTEQEVFPFFHNVYQSCYDNANTIICLRDGWRQALQNGFAGAFRWTGFDYLGEAHEWPARSGNFGVIDLCGFPKDPYYLYQRLWSDKPMLHLLPHWTWPQISEGTVIPVWAISNCESVELFVNGRSLGEQSVEDRDNLSWDVPYEPGVIRAVAKTAGKIVLVAEQRTAEAPQRIELIADRQLIAADGQDVSHITVRVLDRNGVLAPHAVHRIHFSVEGAGILLGVENGDPLDHDNCKDSSRKAFAGMCLAIVQAARQPGTIRISARGEGLDPASIEVLTHL